MAFTGSPTSSTEYALVGTRDNEALAVEGRLHVATFSYTHAAGAGVGEINLCKLPAGRVRIFIHLSHVIASQMAASADLHLGHRAYVNQAGTTVAENDDLFAANLDSGGGVIDEDFALPATGAPWHDIESQDGVIIYAMIDTGNIEDNDTIHGYVTYARIS